MLTRLTERLRRSRDRLAEGLNQIVSAAGGQRGDVPFDPAAVEALLLGADLGVGVVDPLMARLRAELDVGRWRRLAGSERQEAVTRILREGLLESCGSTASAPRGDAKPLVTLMVGVNGTGKTTTTAKLAARWRQQGRVVVMGAADTFRAAAVEQLQAWGARLAVPVISQATGADPAAVAFDAVQAGLARGADHVLIDTAGRLHTKSNLMEELKKVARVTAKALPGAPHEVLLVLDATVGQNGLIQAEQFHDAVGVTGVVVTKLDGTAKGGIVVAVAQTLKVPVRYVGVGEAADDLLDFDPVAYVDALLAPPA